jgi:YidC/Oxa1 family membrane protein insertase
MDNNKNFLLFAVLCVLILLGNNYLHAWLQPNPPPGAVAPHTQTVLPAPTPASAALTLRERSEVIKASPRVPLQTPELAGSINLKGARLDDLVLTRYRETGAVGSPQVTLLSPADSAAPYNAKYAEFSWLAESKDIAVPTSDTQWQAEGKELTPQHPLKLVWKNAQGLSFEREIAVDDQYMFTLTDRVINSGAASVTLYPFGLVARQGNPVLSSSTVLHEGPLGVLGGTLEEFKYKKLIDDGKKTLESDGGWLGITSKYWLVAMAPQKNEKLSADFVYDRSGASDPNQGHFQADFRGAPLTIAPGANATHVVHFFAGAKELSLLDSYADKYDIPHLDRAIDFGWFYFLTKPFLYMLSFLGSTLGSLGIAILVFTVMLKLVTLPLSLKSNHSMARMKTLQPEIKRLQERFADDKIRQNKEMMELFKREKVSPMSGCVPTLIQIPIFFALYKVLYVGIEMRQAPFYGWIHDMSAPDPTSVLTLFGALHVTLPDAMHIGIWPILMGCSMFLQQRMSPQTMDKSQARMFMFMPIIFTYMLAQMPAGLVIYWTWSNLLSILQQWFIMRRDIKGKTA